MNKEEIEIKISDFNINSFIDSESIEKYIKLFNIDEICKKYEFDMLQSKNIDLFRSVSSDEDKPFLPEYDDLCRLHFLALSRKCMNIMEFGSGFSTVVLADAMRLLHDNYFDFAKSNFRVENPFHVFSIEEEQKFKDFTVKRLGNNLSKYATVSISSIDVILHEYRISTLYSKLPNINPDFIYLDGPSQFNNSNDINGFSLSSISKMPMSADILLFEFFLEPGTLILVDGRTANARFLKSYLRRNWNYLHDYKADVHYFELQETPLGVLNERKLNFCLNNRWLL
jgi:hypothetical protein